MRAPSAASQIAASTPVTSRAHNPAGAAATTSEPATVKAMTSESTTPFAPIWSRTRSVIAGVAKSTNASARSTTKENAIRPESSPSYVVPSEKTVRATAIKDRAATVDAIVTQSGVRATAEMRARTRGTIAVLLIVIVCQGMCSAETLVEGGA
ncbi:unannotated protein [freshwater metagenome]|uniref:Unannotated protein n=1 Tax=freshwater metagenome TaxID=449393 RepID=A0A6J6GIB7_9ZZZZ